MLDRNTILESIRCFFALKEVPPLNAAIASMADDYLDWLLLVETIDDDLNNLLDLDMDEADRLGGSPDSRTPIDPTVTVGQLVDFILEQPVLTLERTTLKEIGKLVGMDTDSVFRGYTFRDAKQWMALYSKLSRRLEDRHQTTLDPGEWKTLGRMRAPCVEDV
ncbi:MAG: hypothetical protein KDD69_20050, partial [Bdellovibrionales bacterium]|nr:hypothetical protein [Bdellovibrionales bacterium]